MTSCMIAHGAFILYFMPFICLALIAVVWVIMDLKLVARQPACSFDINELNNEFSGLDSSFFLFFLSFKHIFRQLVCFFLKFFIKALATAQALKVCRAPGPTTCLKLIVVGTWL